MVTGQATVSLTWKNNSEKKKENHIHAGPAKPLPERWIGHAPLKFTYFGVIFLHERTPTNKPQAGLIFPPRDYDRKNDPKKTKAATTCLEKNEGRLSVCLHMRSKTRLKIQIDNRKIQRGIADIRFFPVFLCRLLNISNRV